jgi:hypothetical protein
VATWAEFEREAPDVAEVAARLWPGQIALHHDEPLPKDGALVRRQLTGDRSARRWPARPSHLPDTGERAVVRGDPLSSPKGWDLRRDPRCVIHAMPGVDDDELCIRAMARDVSDDTAIRTGARAVVARTAVGGMIESVSHDPLFEFDLRQVDVARWVDIGQPGTHAVRRHWRAT